MTPFDFAYSRLAVIGFPTVPDPTRALGTQMADEITTILQKVARTYHDTVQRLDDCPNTIDLMAVRAFLSQTIEDEVGYLVSGTFRQRVLSELLRLTNPDPTVTVDINDVLTLFTRITHGDIRI